MDDIRSFLFVPGDSERKIAKAQSCAADALILDLEDSVAPANREAARALCFATLQSGSSKKLFVRINALETADALLDLVAVVRGRPYGVMLPKCQSADAVGLVHRYLTALEVRDAIVPGTTKILPIATETAGAMFGAASYTKHTPRLGALIWGGEDLAADIGAFANRDSHNRYVPTYEYARTVCLLAATAAGVKAVDAVYTNFRDPVGLRTEAEMAARDGFTAKAAIHPDQVEIINAVFTPDASTLAFARRVVELFQDIEGTGVAVLDGKMLDRPHLRMAERILSRAHNSQG